MYFLAIGDGCRVILKTKATLLLREGRYTL
jgi:hypothetical protein